MKLPAWYELATGVRRELPGSEFLFLLFGIANLVLLCGTLLVLTTKGGRNAGISFLIGGLISWPLTAVLLLFGYFGSLVGLFGPMHFTRPPYNRGEVTEIEVAKHVRRLKSPNVYVRALGAYALGELRERASNAIPDLAHMLGGPGALGTWPEDGQIISTNVSKIAADALAKIGKPSLEFSLSAMGRDGDDELSVVSRIRARQALEKIGTPAVDRLIECLRSNNWPESGSAATALGRIGDPRAIRPLLEHVTQSSSVARGDAAVALAMIGDDEIVAILIGELKIADPRSVFGTHLVDALGESGDSRALPLLLTKLDEPILKSHAIEALGRIGDTRAVDALVPILNNDHCLRRQDAARALGRIGGAQVVEPLLNALLYHLVKTTVRRGGGGVAKEHYADDCPGFAHSAVAALAEVGAPALDSVLRAFEEGDRTVRPYLAEVLGGICDARAVPLLVPALQDDGRMTRQKAAIALGRLGGPQAITPLLQGACDKERGFQYEAMEALERIGREAVPALVSILRKKNGPQRLAADALGKIRDVRAVQPLLEYLEEEGAPARREALRALGQIGDTRAVDALRGAIDDPELRFDAAVALAAFGEGEAIDILEEALEDAELRQSAVLALKVAIDRYGLPLPQ